MIKGKLEIILDYIIILLIIFLFISVIENIFSKIIPQNITYMENGNELEAIEYKNKIYIRKEGL